MLSYCQTNTNNALLAWLNTGSSRVHTSGKTSKRGPYYLTVVGKDPAIRTQQARLKRAKERAERTRKEDLRLGVRQVSLCSFPNGPRPKASTEVVDLTAEEEWIDLTGDDDAAESSKSPEIIDLT